MPMSRRARILAVPGALLVLSQLTACVNKSTVATTPGTSMSTSPSSTASAAVNPCAGITAAEASTVMGSTVTSTVDPGGGCTFAVANDPTATSANIAAGISANDGGGIQGAKAGSQSIIDGKAQDIAGVGDSAYVVAGKGRGLGSDSIQAQGAVLIKGQFILVTLTDISKSKSVAEMAALATALIKLVASKV